MAEAKALLDMLMGKDRNKDASERKARKWSDSDVCENFICGFCCHDLFTNTKSDIGFCAKDHDEACQEQFKAESYATQCRVERRFLRHLQDQIRSVDLRVRRGKEREEKNPNAKEGEAVGPYALEINSKNEAIRALQKEAEALGEDGKIDELNEAMGKLENLKKEKEQLEAKNKASTTPYGLDRDGQSQMTICEICGVWKSENPDDARAKNHFSGKQHQGFEMIRNKIKELEEKEGVGHGNPPKEEEKEEDTKRSRSRDRGRDRDRRDSGAGRDRDRDRARERDSGRDKDRSRRDRSRSRDRKRRSRSRSRDRKKRSRSRSSS